MRRRRGGKTLSIYVQMMGNGPQHKWFTIFGSGMTQGPTTVNPLRLFTSRTARSVGRPQLGDPARTSPGPSTQHMFGGPSPSARPGGRD